MRLHVESYGAFPDVYGIRAEVATMKEKKVIVMDERSF